MNLKYVKKGIKGILYDGPKNLILRVIDKPPKPRWLWFGVTDRCNSRCIHCNIWRSQKTKDLITLEEIERVFSDPLLKNLEIVILSGGEPVLRDDIKELVLTIHKNVPKARIILSTNGLLPDRVIETAKFALENRIPFEVGVSLDGIGEKHDFIRGVKGNFEKVDYLLNELKNLREKYGKEKLEVTIGLTLSDYAAPSLEEVKKYSQKLGLNFIAQWYNTSSYYENIGQNIATTNKDVIRAVQSLPCSPLREMWLKLLRGKSIKFPCFAMYTFCVLQWDGSISPCLSFWDFRAGNIKKNSFTEIWYNSEAKKIRKIVKNCQGCLNSWGTGWSFQSYFYRYLLFYLKHPKALIEKLKENKK